MRVGFPILILAFFAALVYVTWHLWRITPGGWPAKVLVTGLFLLWMALAFVNMPLSEKVSVRAATVLYNVGYPWLMALLYLLLTFIVADVLALCKALPKAFLSDSLAGLLCVTGLVAAILVAGGVHYRHKYREGMTITTEKPLDKPLTLVLASDLHLGYGNRRAELSRWIDLINAERPDLVLFGGDVVDLHLRPVLEGGYAEEFRRLDAPAFAVLGNHEYYGDPSASTLMPGSRFCGIPWPGSGDWTSSAGMTGPTAAANPCPNWQEPPGDSPSCWTTSRPAWRRPNRPASTSSSAATPTTDRSGPCPGSPTPCMKRPGDGIPGERPDTT